MPVRLTNEEIKKLIEEVKVLPENYRDILIGSKMKKEDVHKRGDLKIVGGEGNIFYIKTRLSNLNALDFSAILGYEFKGTTGIFLLRRYNGKSHQHTNKLDGKSFRKVFHIHYATEQYQLAGYSEESYAESTERYSDLYGAINCLISDCNCVLPPGESPMLL
jgi:hypothetical protein